MNRSAHPSSQPAEFEIVPLPVADGHYVTIVVRNHRIAQVGGTADRPVLVREFLDDGEFRALTDAILEELTSLDGPSLCFVGDGFDPSSVGSEDDEEALEQSEAWAAVVFVGPEEVSALREAVSGALVDHNHPSAWVMPYGSGGQDMVVRAADHHPGASSRRRDDSYWYMAVPFPRRADGSTVDPASPAVQRELRRRVDDLDDVTLLRCFRRALDASPDFDPGDGPPAEAMRRLLREVASDLFTTDNTELTSRLCLEGTTFVLAGDITWFMHEEPFYAHLAAMEASGVADDPFADDVPEDELLFDPALRFTNEVVTWYADLVADVVGGQLGDPAQGLADTLAAHLSEHSREAGGLLRSAALAEHHQVS